MCAKIERDEIGLAARQDGDGRRRVAKVAAVVKFRQSHLYGAVAAIDHDHLRLYPGDRAERLADLFDPLDLIMENIGMLGAEAADARQQALTKPQGSLGRLEALSVQIAGITGNARPRLSREIYSATSVAISAPSFRIAATSRASCSRKRVVGVGMETA